MTQYLLEGLAGLLLAEELGSALVPRLRARADRRAAITPAVLGTVAVVTSLTQCVIGLILTSAAQGRHITTSGGLFNLVNQLDGVKMLALTVAAVSLAAIGRPAPAQARWLRVTAYPARRGPGRAGPAGPTSP